MEAYLSAVWDEVDDGVKDAMDPDSRAALKELITSAMIKNKQKLPATKLVKKLDNDSPSDQFKTKLDTGKGTTVSAYNLHWNHWKERNTQKEYSDPNDDSQKISQHKYWKTVVWPNLEKTEKQKWQTRANEQRKKIKEQGGSTTEKRNVSISGFQLFLKKMKSKMNAKEEFTHPSDGRTVKLHHYLIYVWSNHVKDDDVLKEPFEEMAKNLKEEKTDDDYLDKLPYINPEQLRSGDLDNLELIEE